MNPVTALRRISYLLERDGADTYKVRAFRNAARAVEPMSESELAELAARGRLQSIPGVGRSTALAITEALAGEVPAYLATLETEPPSIALEAPAEALLGQLRGDCHSHSDWSDGGSTISEMAEAARELGHSYLVLTDHSARLTVAHGLDAARLRQQLAAVQAVNEEMAPFRILTGIEVDILEDGTLDQDEDLLERLDVVVASVHSKLRMDAAAMTPRMIAAVSNPLVDILGHCTGRIVVGRGRPQSSFDHDAVFAACAAAGTAVEVNSRPDRLDPPVELIRVAAAAGCRFSIDSDAHAPGQLSWLRFGCAQATEAGLTAPSVVNALPLPEFLAWAAHR